MKLKGPKFNKGDLVRFKQDSIGSMIEGVGIIVSDPLLLFKHEWPENYSYRDELWSYDVRIDNTIFKMIPEEFLVALNEER